MLDTLSRLVDKSLVLAIEAAGETRYSRLETIRQYSREKFAETDEVEVVRDRHLAYYVQFSEMAEEHVQRRDAILWSRRLEAEQDNLRAALMGPGAKPGQRPAHCRRAAVFLERGRVFGRRLSVDAAGPGTGRSDRAARRTAEAPERLAAKAKALCGLAWSYLSQGDNQNALRWAEAKCRVVSAGR